MPPRARAGPVAGNGLKNRAARRWTCASLVANIVIVVTGGAVRLTSSGLGCPTWPRCTAASYVSTAADGLHGTIEFGNRLLTIVLAVIAVGTLRVVWRLGPDRGDLRRLAVAVGLAIPAQAGIGGVTVLTGLNPWVVMLHFLVSMAAVALAVVLVRRCQPASFAAERPLPALARGLISMVLLLLAAVLVLGTVTTGSGPHAGDAAAVRTGLDPGLMARVHGDLAILLVAATVALSLVTARIRISRQVRSAITLLAAVQVLQAAVGYAQHTLGLPAPLVVLHLLGATLSVAATADLCVALRQRSTAATSSAIAT